MRKNYAAIDILYYLYSISLLEDILVNLTVITIMMIQTIIITGKH